MVESAAVAHGLPVEFFARVVGPILLAGAQTFLNVIPWFLFIQAVDNPR